ncbi:MULTISPECIES: Hsp33 family molecular chaperone HslO [Lactiplantibacillus]|jgi:molecular chaperone Hsp33|uniref:33 kDa chaperonin n=3 Tax=Lactiplantibacillus pentosus TaxID=1589 RepID=A0A2K9I441_LACPE|nr:MULTISPECIES: Hsp33 family molecular chaperone HslO [Lactiplantibacillus]CCC16589.1 33 kDa chaperonin (heat shock protein 33 homolog) (HSP33) [Lactiplantibacillus pentosus IG1]AUI79755.1 Hsp33 family molecular chaperone [Lactiplantibacillus pentosus]AYG39330.1 Hsp33 family molecular chaperone HslO [Lactiplantibacillus pentosus]AYG41990.1 Hsp33 family molecular chaperone HslO [Lactiplantibacillus pentosus]MBO9166336.1 Hsp33 family molecular chaperone HslO [Lactiplantibacillus pentosus]
MSDYLVKSVAGNEMFRAYAVDATGVVAEAQQRHDTWSAASAALGRSLVGTLLLASSVLKGDEQMTVKINGNGPVGGIVIDGNAKGTVKGYLQHPHIHLPLNEQHKIDVKTAVGTDGFLSVTKDQGVGDPFTGTVALVSGELGEDFTYYLAQSEQIPSAVGLSVFVNDDNSIGVAGGFLVQVLPNATDEAISSLEAKLKDLPLVSQLMREGKTPEDILDLLFDGDVKVLDKMPVKFECDCSKERFAEALMALPKHEVRAMIDEDHGATAVCHFCGSQYQFSEAELEAVLSRSKGAE